MDTFLLRRPAADATGQRSLATGVLGSGVMGRQLASLLAAAGHRVTVWDVELSATFEKDVRRSLRLFGRQRGMDKDAAGEACRRITYGTDFKQLRSCSLVLEAVKEDQHVKHRVLSQLSRLLDPRAIIASNTSTLSIAALARAVSHPGRFLGLHFFNPITSISLVEVIRGPQTGREVTAAATDLLIDLGKKPVVVPDVPGFVVNRLLFLMINEAIRLVEQQGVGPELIDQCMRLGAAHPMGPLELADYIGLDTCLAILDNLHAATGDDAYRPAPLLCETVGRGHLGQKTGGGFYR